MLTNISLILIGLGVLITNWSLVRLSYKLKIIDEDLRWAELYIKNLQTLAIEHEKQIKELKKKNRGDKK